MNVVSWKKRIGWHALLAACGILAGGQTASAQIGWTPTPGGEICTAERTVSGIVIEKKTCIRWKPVTQVCMTPEQSVTYHDVCRVGFRPEQFLQCVPKTTYDQITVDEGSWKMVWCPKSVTKVIPRTTMEQQVATRQVPYQYTEKVPQVVTRMVPKYSTKYVPETYQTVEQKPFHHRLPTKQTTMMPPTCSAPIATCSSPIPACSAPAPMPMTTYSPPVAPSCVAPMEMPVTTYSPPQPQVAYAPPTCALPQPPTCALPHEPACAMPGSGVYPPATYSPEPVGHVDRHGHHHHGPTEAAPLPMSDPQSYYPTQQQDLSATKTEWSDFSAPTENGAKTTAVDKSLAALWNR